MCTLTSEMKNLDYVELQYLLILLILIATLTSSMSTMTSYSLIYSDLKLHHKPSHLNSFSNPQHSSSLASSTFSSTKIFSSTRFFRSLNPNSAKQDLLNYINLVSSKIKCSKSVKNYISLDAKMIPSFLIRNKFNMTYKGVNLLSSIFSNYNPSQDNFHFLKSAFQTFVNLDLNIYKARIIWLDKKIIESEETFYPSYYLSILESKSSVVSRLNHSISYQEPWLKLSKQHMNLFEIIKRGNIPVLNFLSKNCEPVFDWTNAYYSCEHHVWLFSYISLILLKSSHHCEVKGLISIDININQLDINQCDTLINPQWTISLLGTHKCHHQSSKCVFKPGHGWNKGGYQCQCRKGFFPTSVTYLSNENQYFNGIDVEKAWDEKVKKGKSVQYDMIYVCQRCSEGCETCKDGSACLSPYNWAFRIALLTVSIFCIFFTIILAFYIYKHRKKKVFKVASPIFLCITLLGCAIMYSEVAAIFPVYTSFYCILSKITRHMGFCITYSSLLLKTWRVSLTYRVKSAHKLKLTDLQLLHWLFPILLITAIFIGTWTISAPPVVKYVIDWNGLKFKICEYNWWDHSLWIGECLFLLWGVKVCYNVRNAESFFNEAKYITWAIYNIAVVSILMIIIHLLNLPTAGPDIKYVFDFLRTQLNTTSTILLVFGPKVYRVLKGQGDVWDNRVRARGINASFSLNGVGLVHDETNDLYHENEELKEEIHKMATRMEMMKLMQMEINNRHLKYKYHHSPQTVTITTNPNAVSSVNQSPIVKAVYSRLESNDAPSPRISPAAELVSERV